MRGSGITLTKLFIFKIGVFSRNFYSFPNSGETAFTVYRKIPVISPPAYRPIYLETKKFIRL